jgi:hypothetical protein
MKEIFFIILSIPIFFLYFSFPVNSFNAKKIISNYNLSYYDTILFNIIINLNLLLVCSFFKINFHIIFAFQIFFSLLFIFFYFKDYLIFFKRNCIFLFLLILFLLVYFVKIAANPSLAWDGLHWFYKTQTFYQDGNLTNLNSLPFSYYPHLGTYIWAFFWKNSFIDAEYFGRYFYVFFYILTIASAVHCLNKHYSLLNKILLFTFIVIITSDFYLFGGYQEYLIFCLFYIFSRFFLFFKERNGFNLFTYLILILTINLFLWVKQEGFFYFFILSLIFLLHSKSKIKINFFTISLMSFFFFIFYLIKLKVFGGISFNTKIIHENVYDILNFELLLNKFIFISKYFIISFFKFPLLICVVISFWLLGKKFFLKKHTFFLSFSFLSLSLTYAIYFQSASNHEWLIPITLSRILFGISGFYLIVFIQSLNSLNVKRNINF